MPSIVVILVIGVAGALGAVARYLLAEWVTRRWQGHFPLPTLLINMTGAFALGFVLTAGSGAVPGLAKLRLVVGSGFLGGYTTFSTLAFETHALAQRGKHAHAWLNGLLSLLAGIAAAALGVALGRMV